MNAKDSKYLIFILFPQEMGYLWTKSIIYMERSKEEIEEIKWEAHQEETEQKTAYHTSASARMSGRMACQARPLVHHYKYREGANVKNTNRNTRTSPSSSSTATLAAAIFPSTSP